MDKDFKPEPLRCRASGNNSPNNTGIHDLPPAQPAFIYYPPSASTKFPVVGSGGRTANGRTVYYFDPKESVPTSCRAEV